MRTASRLCAALLGLASCGDEGSSLDELTATDQAALQPPSPRPPTRMLAVGAALGSLNFFSICDDSFEAAMAAIVQP